MEQQDEEHLLRIIKSFNQRVVPKYRRGQAEHGGHLWAKHDLLDQAIDEAIDMLVYLLTMKEQQEAQLEAQIAVSAASVIPESNLSPNEE